ncbi:MAG: hypothetical protein L6R42_009477 [Xanthoria sp. 1 TBL-2021]|nr:MAG: hypothetical protein L6R42_009477 [Xanthoria sp. 1 TBL-2021]
MKTVPPAGPDFETAIFTITASPASVVIWVNWVEFGDEMDKNGNRVSTYHMNKLRTYLWDDRDSLRALRAALHNIMDWAVYVRLPKAKELHTKDLPGAEEKGYHDSQVKPAEVLHYVGSGQEVSYESCTLGNERRQRGSSYTAIAPFDTPDAIGSIFAVRILDKPPEDLIRHGG